MVQEIILKTILTIIGIVVTSSVGYLAHKAKDYRTKLHNKEANEKLQNVALLNIVQKQLNDVFFKYEPEKQIFDYVYRNWKNLYKTYKELGGNDYMEEIADKMKTWEIIKTDILEHKEA